MKKYSSNGLTVTLTTPPDGFIPANGSPDELDRFQIPASMRTSKQPMSGESGVGFCDTGFQNTTQQSYNKVWGGRIVQGAASAYADVSARPIIPGYSPYCDNYIGLGASEESFWVGLGGTHGVNSPLLQDGMYTQAANGWGGRLFFFWEVVGPYPSAGGFSGAPINQAGNTVSFETTYNAVVPVVYFNVGNESLNWSAGANVSGSTLAADYDGTTADFVVERPLRNDGVRPPLRRSSDYDPWWNSEYVNGNGVNTYPNQIQITMTSDGSSNGTVLNSTVLGATTTQSNTWHWCA